MFRVYSRACDEKDGWFGFSKQLPMTSDDKSIATIVSQAGHDDHVSWFGELMNFFSATSPCILHQDETRHAVVFDGSSIDRADFFAR